MFQCKTCKKLENENQYLRTLVDRLLVKTNTAPVDPNPALGARLERELSEEEKTSGNDVETYGR